MRDIFKNKFGNRTHPAVRSHFDAVKRRDGTARAVRETERALRDATFNRGPLAGRTGDPFKDDPFFNPWAKGGSFNK